MQLIGVINAGTANGVFEIVASADSFPILLREGYPMYDQVDLVTPAFFKFAQQTPAAAVHLQMTQLSGDSDLCIVRNRTRLLQHPSVLGRWWDLPLDEQGTAWVDRIADVCEWSSTLFGSDVLTIPHTDPKGGVGDYFVAVLGSTAGTSSFHLVATTADDTEVMLVGGRPQHGSLNGGEWNYYRLDVGPDTANVTFTLTPSEGDPDIYLNTGGRPVGRRHDQHIAFTGGSGIDSLVLRRNESGFFPPVQIDIGVFAWSASSYSIIARVAQGACTAQMEDCGGHQHEHAMQLQEAMPFLFNMDATGYAYFDFDMGTSSDDVQLVMTTIVGEPVLYASFSPFYGAFPSEAKHELEAGSVAGVIDVSGTSTALQLCRDDGARSCLLHAAVHCTAHCAFTILAHFIKPTPVVMVDGRPQLVSLRRDAFSYYSFSARNASEVSFVVTPDAGSAEMYVALQTSSSVRPSRTPGSFVWAVSDASVGLRLSESDAHFCSSCTYVLGLVASTDASFSITASASSTASGPSPPPPGLLQDGAPLSVSLHVAQCKAFSWRVATSSSSPELLVTPFAGQPSVYANFQPEYEPLTLPSMASHGAATWPAAAINGSRGEFRIGIPQAFADAHPGTYNVVACAGAEHARLSLTANADASNPILLVGGAPQQAAVPPDAWLFFRFRSQRETRKVCAACDETAPMAALMPPSTSARIHLKPLLHRRPIFAPLSGDGLYNSFLWRDQGVLELWDCHNRAVGFAGCIQVVRQPHRPVEHHARLAELL